MKWEHDMFMCTGKSKYNSSKGHSIMILKIQWKIPLESLKVHTENTSECYGGMEKNIRGWVYSKQCFYIKRVVKNKKGKLQCENNSFHPFKITKFY